MKDIAATILVLFGLCTPTISSAERSFLDELNDKADLDRLWQSPTTGEKCIKFSSFDPASKDRPGRSLFNPLPRHQDRPRHEQYT